MATNIFGINKNLLHHILLGLLIFLLTGCGSTQADLAKTAIIGEFSANNGSVGESTLLGTEQYLGYSIGFERPDLTVNPVFMDERSQQSDFQRMMRDLVEDKSDPLGSIIGATTNNGTSRSSSLVNFFNIPMIIPSASGENIFPSDNLWAFRLSAPSSAYAGYFFGSFINKNSIEAILTDPNGEFVIPPDFKIAIIYEQDTFGESAAVATANAAIAQSINIGLYKSFDPSKADPASLIAIAKTIKESGSQLVYIVVSDPILTKNVIQSIKNVFPVKFLPLMIGQAGGFSSKDFQTSVEANGVYVLEQAILPTNCPDTILSNYDAQSYAALYLLDQANKIAGSNFVSNQNWWEKITKQTPTVLQKREAIRDALKQTNLDVPCLGIVAFDNSGQNKFLNLEMIQVNNRKSTNVDATTFLDALEMRIALDQLQ